MYNRNKILSTIILILLIFSAIPNMFGSGENNNVVAQDVFNPTNGDTSNWWNEDWSYRKLITFDSSQIPSTLTNFPVLYNVTDSDLAEAQSDADDFVFISYDDNSTQYNHEIELFDDGTNELVVWINITSLSSSSDTKVWMYYGNNDCANQENVAGTWNSDYLAVWHMDDASGGIDDSTGTYDGTAYGTPAYEQTGAVGNAIDLDLNTDYFKFSDTGWFDGTNDFTMECYMNTDVNNREQWMIQSRDESLTGIRVRADPNIQFVTWVGSQNNLVGPSYTTHTWYHCVAVYDADVGKELYVDYSSQYSNSDYGVFDVNNEDNCVGAGDFSGGNPVHGFDGTLDEVRLYKNAVSDAWVETSYNTMNNATNGGFFNTGNEIIGPKSWYDGDWAYAKKITLNSSQIPSTLTNFPVVISTIDADLKRAQSDGDDFLFVNNENNSKYNHEIEQWDDNTGTFVAWVNITSLSSSSDTVLWLYYGNSGVASQEDIAGTWNSDFAEVYHFEDDGSFLTDSVGNEVPTNHGCVAGQSGIAGDGLYVDGHNDYVSGFDNIYGNRSISLWYNVDTFSGANSYGIITSYGGDFTRFINENDRDFRAYWEGGWGVWRSYGGTYINTDTWYYHSATQNVDTETDEIFTNGTKWAGGTDDIAPGTFYRLFYHANSRVHISTLDEFRIYQNVMSSDWFTTEYNTMLNATDGGFFTIGDEQTSFNDSWTYRVKITIDHNDVDSDLTNFPMLVNYTFGDTSKVQNDGDDILFTSSGGSKLNHEIELYNSTSGQLFAWVNVTFISSSTPDSYIYLYYGNSTVANQENIEGTWDSNYEMVHHLHGSSYTALDDSTSNNHDVDTEGGDPTYEQLSGFGYAVGFDGNGDYLKIPDSAGFDISGRMTISFKLNSQFDTSSPDRISLVHQCPGSTSAGDYKLYLDTTNGKMRWFLKGGGWASIYSDVDTWYADTLYVVTVAFGNGGMKMWVNGDIQSDTDAFDGGISGNFAFTIGLNEPGYEYYLDGLVDEIQMSKIARSDAWIVAGFNTINYSYDGGFYLLGSEEGGEPAANTAPNTPTGLAPHSLQTGGNASIYATCTDPDGDGITLYFYDDSDDSEIGSTIIASGGNGTVTWVSLARGTTHTFYAKAYDGALWSSNSSTCSFDMNVLPVVSNARVGNLSNPLRFIDFTPYFNWTVSDGDGHSQTKYQVQVGTSENGSEMWDTGEITSGNKNSIYSGSALSRGTKYYFRVRAYDGYEWSEW